MKPQTDPKETSWKGYLFHSTTTALFALATIMLCYFLSIGPLFWAWNHGVIIRGSVLFPVVEFVYEPIFDFADANSGFGQVVDCYLRFWGQETE